MEKALCFSLFLILLPSVNANEVDELKRLVISLNSHVLNLENPVKIQNNNISNSKVVWRKLKKGMTPSQVRNLLGEPIDINNGGSFVDWYYSKNQYHSTVRFFSGVLYSSKETNN
jgi:outer membrane protein assembly factor BamE (lipoprotein component of BamABCDE complex)